MARPRSANRRRFVVALIVLTSLTLITLDNRSGRTGPLGAVGRVAHAVVSPLQRAVGAVSRPISDWWSGVADAGHLKHENRTLRQQIAALEGRQRSASVALNQDKALKEMLGLGQQLSNNAKPVVARVVDRDPGNFESTITLDRGTEAGIDDGMAVLAPNGVVGDVIDSWHGGSKVRVLTDQAQHVEVDQEVNAVALAAGNLVEKGAEARPQRFEFEVGLQLVRQDGVIGEGKFLGRVLDEEVEGVDRRQVGGEFDLDLELVGLFRENEPGLKIALRVLLPIEEVFLRRDLERVIEDRRPAMDGGTQAHDLRPERNRLGVAVMGDVAESGVNGHEKELPATCRAGTIPFLGKKSRGKRSVSKTEVELTEF